MKPEVHVLLCSKWSYHLIIRRQSQTTSIEYKLHLLNHASQRLISNGGKGGTSYGWQNYRVFDMYVITNYYQVLHKQGASIRTFTYTEGTRNMLILGPGESVAMRNLRKI